MEEHNSGHPSTKGFDTDIDKGYVFNSIYSYNPDDANSIYRTYECVFKGTDLYPIAIEASGNTVCFDLNRKQLVLWNHESEEAETIDTSSNPELFIMFE